MEEYNFEERQLLTSFMEKYVEHSMDGDYYNDLIEKLNVVKYGDIKTKIGTKFSLKSGRVDDTVFVVGTDGLGDLVLINTNRWFVCLPSIFPDESEIILK